MSADSVDSIVFDFNLAVIGAQVGKSSLLERFANDVFTENLFTTMKRAYKNKEMLVEGFKVLLRLYDTPGSPKFWDSDYSFLSSAHGIVFMYDITSRQSFDFIKCVVLDVSRIVAKKRVYQAASFVTNGYSSANSFSSTRSNSSLYNSGVQAENSPKLSLFAQPSSRNRQNTIITLPSGEEAIPAELDPFMLLIGNKTDLVNRRMISEIEAQDFADEHNMWYCEVSAKTGDSCSESFEAITKSLVIRERHRKKLSFPDTEDVNYKIISFKCESTEENRGIQVIRSATLEKLFARLLDVDSIDSQFQKAFMLTYRSFITPIELLKRFITVFTEQRGKSTQLRVVNLMKFWIQNFPLDFSPNAPDLSEKEIEERKELRSTFTQFSRNVLSLVKPELDKMLTKALEKDPSRKRPVFSSKPPVVIVPKKPIFLEMSPIEFARQLTLVEYDLLSAIEPREFLGLSWTKKNKEINSPNIVRMIDFSNKISRFYTKEILSFDKPKNCSKALKTVFKVADELFSLKNFNGLMEVVSCLSNSAIFRMKKTWKLCKGHKFAEYEELLESKNNFGRYREMLRRTSEICVPYLGIYLTDLTFIEEGNKDNVETLFVPSQTNTITQMKKTTPKDHTLSRSCLGLNINTVGTPQMIDRPKSSELSENSEPSTPTIEQPSKKILINFEKRRMIASTILEVQQYQQSGYNLEVEPTIKNFLLSDLPGLEIEDAYELSLKIEPRKEK